MTSIFRSIVHGSISRSIQIGSFVQQVLSNTWVFLTGIADFTFTRTGDQFGIDSGGNLVKATTGVSAHIFGEGILLEGARTNLFLNSFVPATQTITVAAVAHTITVKGTGDITVTGVGAGVATEGSPLTLIPTAGGLICTVNGTLANVNVEVGAFGSSFIETFGATATRSATTLTRAWPFPANGISGQIKVRPIADSDVDTTTRTFLYFSDGTSSNELRIVLEATNTIGLFKILGGVGASLRKTSTPYSGGDLLNIRFRADSTGINLWFNADAKQSLTTGVAPTDWVSKLSQIEVATYRGTSQIQFQTAESLRIWNEAKSDSFMENLT